MTKKEYEELILYICSQSKKPPVIPKLELLTRHGIVILFANRYRQKDSFYIKLTEFKRLYTMEVLESIAFIKKLDNKFNDMGWRYIVLKGVALSKKLYQESTTRYSVDIDIFIDKKDRFDVINWLFQNGFTTNQYINLKYQTYITLTDKRGLTIDISWEFVPYFYPVKIPKKILFNRTKLSINGISLPVLKKDEEFLYLLIHASKHLYSKMIWIIDIDRYMRYHNIDYTFVVDRLNTLKAIKYGLYGIYLSNKILKTPLPKEIQKNIYKYDYNKIYNYTYMLWQNRLPIYKKIYAKSMLYESTEQKLKYLHYSLLKPTIYEYKILKLPKYLWWIYYLIRISRLILKIISKNINKQI